MTETTRAATDETVSAHRFTPYASLSDWCWRCDRRQNDLIHCQWDRSKPDLHFEQDADGMWKWNGK